MSDRRESVALAIGRARFPKYGDGPASDYDRKLADAAIAAMQHAEPTEAEVDAATATITETLLKLSEDWSMTTDERWEAAMHAALIAARKEATR